MKNGTTATTWLPWVSYSVLENEQEKMRQKKEMKKVEWLYGVIDKEGRRLAGNVTYTGLSWKVTMDTICMYLFFG